MKHLHRHSLRALLFSWLALVSLGAVTLCQNPPPRRPSQQLPDDGVHDSVAGLVAFPVTVTDKNDRPVTTLGHDAFTVSEDKVPGQLAYWLNCSKGDCPMSLAILLDLSGSLKVNPLLDEVRSSLARFMKEIGAKEYTLLGFSDTVQLLTDWTHEPAAIVDGLNRATRLKGATALFDALYTATEKIKQP